MAIAVIAVVLLIVYRKMLDRGADPAKLCTPTVIIAAQMPEIKGSSE